MAKTKTKASAKTAASAKAKAKANTKSKANGKNGINGIILAIGGYKEELRKKRREALHASRTPKEGEAGGDTADSGGFSAEVAELIHALQMEEAALFEEFGTPLSPTERERHISIGIKNFGFVQTAFQQANQNPALVPAYLDMPLFNETMNTLERKRGILTRNEQFGKTVSDSVLTDSDKAYHYSLEFHNYTKEAARQKVAGAEAVYTILKAFFRKSKPQNAEPTEKQVERDVRGLLKGTKEGKILIENENPERKKGVRKVIDEARPDQ